MSELTRRSFIKGAGIFAATGAAVGLSACAQKEEPAKELTIAEKTVWEKDADLIIVGSGSGGLSTAVTAAIEFNMSSVILEVANKDFAGGNSRVCGQGVFCPDNVEDAIAYQTELNGNYYVAPENIRVWAEAMCENVKWMTENLGANLKIGGNAEFPECTGASSIHHYLQNGKSGDSGSYKLFKEKAEELKIPILYETRAVSLIKDEKGEIIGVTDENGKNYKAHKAVVLACGGYEHNMDIMGAHTPAGFPLTRSNSSWYNRGDGIKMAQKVGAQLWHMNNFSGNTFGIKIVDNDHPEMVASLNMKKPHDFIWVGPEGDRFMYEESRGLARHGKVFRSGVWADLDLPYGSHCIFGKAIYDSKKFWASSSFASRTEAAGCKTNIDELIAAGIITKSETVAELAKACNLTEAKMQATLDRYNAYARANEDLDFGRGKELTDEGIAAARGEGAEVNVGVEAFDLVEILPPYYSFEQIPCCGNTQGGPKRGAHNEILDLDDNPIPRLYAAGEMGTIYAYKYNLGGNFGGGIADGRICARTIAKLNAWDAVNTTTVQ